ncbi:MAG: hypothetical protein OXU42_14855 [Deltaproteobacteria bacterium]|nr:hypothetical protein [Deltaproteobacteria bacterium]
MDTSHKVPDIHLYAVKKSLSEETKEFIRHRNAEQLFKLAA